MENLAYDTAAKVEWSGWSRCESSFSMLLVPHRPGVLALAEEVLESNPALGTGKRMLALFFVTEARDLSLAVSGLFAAASPLRERLTQSRCYVRYALISVPEDRKALCLALETWMAASAQRASGILQSPATSQQEESAVSSVRPAATEISVASARPASRAGSHGIAESGPPVFPAGF